MYFGRVERALAFRGYGLDGNGSATVATVQVVGLGRSTVLGLGKWPTEIVPWVDFFLNDERLMLLGVLPWLIYY